MDGNPSPQHQHPLSAQTGVCQFDGTAIAKTIHTPPLDNIIKDKGCYYYRSTATRVELNKRKGLNSNHPSCPLCPLHINLNRRNNVWTDTVTNDATATRVSRYLTPSRITTDSIYFHANAGYLTLGNQFNKSLYHLQRLQRQLAYYSQALCVVCGHSADLCTQDMVSS